MSPSPFIILVALEAEWPKRTDIPLVHLNTSPCLQQSPIMVLVTGVGMHHAQNAASFIKRQCPNATVLNIGTCGRPSQDVPLFSAVHINRYRYRNQTLDDATPIPFLSPTLPTAGLETLDQPFCDSRDCTDMEGFAYANAFQNTDITFCCIKIISDHAPCSRSEFKQRLRHVHTTIEHVLQTFWTDQRQSVSVVIPSYNRANVLKRTLDSVLQQTRPADHIIVVDDGSTDETATLLKPFSGQIDYQPLPVRSGVSLARQHGIACSTTDWICFLDSDDVWQPDKLRHQLIYLQQHPFYALCQSNETWIRHGQPLAQKKYHHKHEGWQFTPSLERCMISPSSVIMHRTLCQAYPFDPFFPVCEDYELWLRITRRFPVGLCATADLIKYGGHPDQLSHRYPVMDHFRLLALLKQLEDPRPHIREAILNTIIEKANILHLGAAKRQLTQRCAFYERVLAAAKTDLNAVTTVSTPIRALANKNRSLGA